jgi:hypothetical protein
MHGGVDVFYQTRYLFFVPLAMLAMEQARAETPYARGTMGAAVQQTKSESYDIRLCSWLEEKPAKSSCCQSKGCAAKLTDCSCCDIGCCDSGCCGCGSGCGLLGGGLLGPNSRASLWVWALLPTSGIRSIHCGDSAKA